MKLADMRIENIKQTKQNELSAKIFTLDVKRISERDVNTYQNEKIWANENQTTRKLKQTNINRLGNNHKISGKKAS